MDYYNRTNPAQALACGYPAGMGQIPVQADGLGADPTAAETALGTVGLVSWMATPFLAGYAARKHGYGWPATVGIFFASNIAYFAASLLTGGLGGFGVTAVSGYYAFKD